MSDTPLTDAIGIMLGHSRHDDDQIVKMINHARTLESENARLRGALQKIVDGDGSENDSAFWAPWSRSDCVEIANIALREK